MVVSHFPVPKTARAKAFTRLSNPDSESEVPSYFNDPLDLDSLKLVQKSWILSRSTIDIDIDRYVATQNRHTVYIYVCMYLYVFV